MKEFLKYILQLIVDHPEEIAIEEIPFSENIYHYRILGNDEDKGKIIGRGGKIIQAIRNVAKIVAIKEGKQIRIDVG